MFYEIHILGQLPEPRTSKGTYTEIPILQPAKQPDSQPSKVEVCRSFSYKLNLANHGGNPYESADFFASRKMECSPDAVEWVSQELFEQCVAEVRASVASTIEDVRRKSAAKRSA